MTRPREGKGRNDTHPRYGCTAIPLGLTNPSETSTFRFFVSRLATSTVVFPVQKIFLETQSIANPSGLLTFGKKVSAIDPLYVNSIIRLPATIILCYYIFRKKEKKLILHKDFPSREGTNLTADVARISLPVHTIDIDRDRHLHVRNVNRASRILVRRREWNPQRGHSLIHQQEVGLVFGPRFAVGPIPDETLVTHAGVLILPSRDARRVRRTDRGIVPARGLRQASETVAVVPLKLPKNPSHRLFSNRILSLVPIGKRRNGR